MIDYKEEYFETCVTLMASVLLGEPEKYQEDIINDSNIKPEYRNRVVADCMVSLGVIMEKLESCENAEDLISKIEESGADNETATFFVMCGMASLELAEKMRNDPDYGIEDEEVD